MGGLRFSFELAKQAIRAGANGYLSKDCDAKTFVKAIRKIAAGGRYIQEEIAEKLAIAHGLSIQVSKDIKTAGLLHDIGKIIISSENIVL